MFIVSLRTKFISLHLLSSCAVAAHTRRAALACLPGPSPRGTVPRTSLHNQYKCRMSVCHELLSACLETSLDYTLPYLLFVCSFVRAQAKRSPGWPVFYLNDTSNRDLRCKSPKCKQRCLAPSRASSSPAPPLCPSTTTASVIASATRSQGWRLAGALMKRTPTVPVPATYGMPAASASTHSQTAPRSSRASNHHTFRARSTPPQSASPSPSRARLTQHIQATRTRPKHRRTCSGNPRVRTAPQSPLVAAEAWL